LTTSNLYSAHGAQVWVSEALSQQISDLAVGDINKDGVNEIVVTAESGNLYAFKWQKQETT